jgi:hypothetical protein
MRVRLWELKIAVYPLLLSLFGSALRAAAESREWVVQGINKTDEMQIFDVVAACAGEIFTKSGAAELVHGVNPWWIAAEFEDVEIERWY